ncbi:MAG: hypothetical protein N2049_00330 [Anaerolineales bacterium]|nr:hypothetical protein [Anaerolineales bacterium]MCX7607650.1 hypothetical protein [Anaerolineales bacterium]
MEYSFPRYLLAKQSVDDRALNKDVLQALKAALPADSLSVVEVGGGIGTMLARLLRWDMLPESVAYTLIDASSENIEYARAWLPRWAASAGWGSETIRQGELRLYNAQREVCLRLIAADVFEVVEHVPTAQLLIAHAFLDLVKLPESLSPLLSLTNNLAWLTLNFDGVTTFLPTFDPALDAHLEHLYHETMMAHGDHQTGRKLFGYLERVGARIVAAGASDWVVYPQDGSYAGDEAYFLHFILHFFEQSLGDHPEVEREAFARWLAARRQQIAQGKLVYLTHQMDFLVAVRRLS